MTEITKSWMWAASSGGVNGVNIDPDRCRLAWFDDAAGCACGDSIAEQSYESFKQNGPALIGVPDDVLTEIQTSVEMLSS